MIFFAARIIFVGSKLLPNIESLPLPLPEPVAPEAPVVLWWWRCIGSSSAESLPLSLPLLEPVAPEAPVGWWWWRCIESSSAESLPLPLPLPELVAPEAPVVQKHSSIYEISLVTTVWTQGDLKPRTKVANKYSPNSSLQGATPYPWVKNRHSFHNIQQYPTTHQEYKFKPKERSELNEHGATAVDLFYAYLSSSWHGTTTSSCTHSCTHSASPRGMVYAEKYSED